MQKLIFGDSLDVLSKFKNNCIDLIATDPNYGIGFMNKDWDKALPDKRIWKECLRVLKPGAFCFVMCIPRSDMQWRVTRDLEEAGFNISFSPIYFTFATGFPKSLNFSKGIDKRLGKEREVIGRNKNSRENCDKSNTLYESGFIGKTAFIDIPASPEAKALNGIYSNQLKPAVEIILVCQKPLTEKSYIDQALRYYEQTQEIKAGKRKATNIKHGGVNLDNCRIPIDVNNEKNLRTNAKNHKPKGDNSEIIKIQRAKGTRIANELKNCDMGRHNSQGRFPANLLCADDVLNDSKNHKTGNLNKVNTGIWNNCGLREGSNHKGDSGSFSRFFSLDAWFEKKLKELPESVQKTFPFLIIPKPSKSEKNKGCEILPEREKINRNTFKSAEWNIDPRNPNGGYAVKHDTKMSNNHPTVKSIKLFSYLITLGSNKNDLVLDPFLGSGTTGIAAKMLNRKFVGIEKETEYLEIAKARIKGN